MKEIKVFHYTYGADQSGTFSVLAGCRSDADSCAKESSDLFHNPVFREITRFKKPTIIHYTLDTASQKVAQEEAMKAMTAGMINEEAQVEEE